MTSLRSFVALAACAAAALACANQQPKPTPPPPPKLNALPRVDFNRRAAELALPLFWRSDSNNDDALDPDELVVIWGVAESKRPDWVSGSSFTQKMLDTYAKMSAADAGAAGDDGEAKRRQLVRDELAQGRPTLIETDLAGSSAEDRAVVRHVMAAAKLVEQIYARQNGVDGLAAQIPPDDAAAQAMFFRNQSPWCEAPKTEKEEACSALATKPPKISGLYPKNLQNGTDTEFCKALEKRKDAQKLMHQFVVVAAKPDGRSEGKPATDELVPLPYHEAYKVEAEQVATELRGAAAAIQDSAEAAMKAYLEAAAQAFLDDSWEKADEAWAAMNATNSKWYLRIGPDETYFEPCSRKAGFHVSFARINRDSVEWQNKLEPVKGEMEKALAQLAGPPYKARDVKFHLPDFIDIVLNAGDSRSAHGATIGQSLPNWGPVAEKGGRTVAMTNLYTDPDSEAAWKEQSSSLFCKATMDKTTFDPKLAIMSTVLHEAAHNLGPSHEYKVKGKTDDQIFGGGTASMLEELKAQSSALWLADWLLEKGIVDAKQAEGAHLRDVTWAFGHISQGMYTADKKPKHYSQLAAIQMGMLHRNGALLWKPEETAANGSDKGCFEVDLAKWKVVVDGLERGVLAIKGKGDKAGAEKLKKEFVDGAGEWQALRDVIAERWLRAPKASFVYALKD